MKFRKSSSRHQVTLQMTPMIDIVFQLLVFFIMTFKIVLPEGDFNIRMPSPADQAPPTPSDTPTLRLRMTAGPQGELTSLRLGERAFVATADATAWEQLRSYIMRLVDDAGGPGAVSDQEVSLECDYELNYQHVIDAITAISGYIQNGQRHTLIERIRFAPPER